MAEDIPIMLRDRFINDHNSYAWIVRDDGDIYSVYCAYRLNLTLLMFLRIKKIDLSD